MGMRGDSDALLPIGRSVSGPLAAAGPLLIAVAPPGSGDFSHLVLPLALSCPKSSMIVFDGKRQLFELCGSARGRTGPVLRIDWRAIDGDEERVGSGGGWERTIRTSAHPRWNPFSREWTPVSSERRDRYASALARALILKRGADASREAAVLATLFSMACGEGWTAHQACSHAMGLRLGEEEADKILARMEAARPSLMEPLSTVSPQKRRRALAAAAFSLSDALEGIAPERMDASTFDPTFLRDGIRPATIFLRGGGSGPGPMDALFLEACWFHLASDFCPRRPIVVWCGRPDRIASGFLSETAREGHRARTRAVAAPWDLEAVVGSTPEEFETLCASSDLLVLGVNNRRSADRIAALAGHEIDAEALMSLEKNTAVFLPGKAGAGYGGAPAKAIPVSTRPWFLDRAMVEATFNPHTGQGQEPDWDAAATGVFRERP